MISVKENELEISEACMTFDCAVSEWFELAEVVSLEVGHCLGHSP